MVSLYGAVTVANLEAFSGLDYSAIDAGLTDGIIESMAISPAEVLCYSHTGATPSSTSSNPIKYGIMTIAAWKLEAWMAKNGINPNSKLSFENYSDMYSCTAIVDVLSQFELSRQTSTDKRGLWVGT